MSCTYFAREVGNTEGSVKIGQSIMPDSRVLNVSAAVKLPLEIVARAPWRCERQFHELLMDWHQGGEWFAASPILHRIIAELTAGVFDFAALPRGRRICGAGRHYRTHIGRYAFGEPEAA